MSAPYKKQPVEFPNTTISKPRASGTTAYRWFKALLPYLIISTITFWVVYWTDPADAKWFPPCVFHSLTGYYCPGCGSTRAIHDLAHFRFQEAFSHNALLVGLSPLLIYFLISDIKKRATGKGLPLTNYKILWAAVFGTLTLLFTILRNLSSPFLQWLDP